MKWTSSSLHLARKRAQKALAKLEESFEPRGKRTKDISLLWKCFCTTYSFHRTRFRTRYSAAFRYFTKIRNLELNHKDFFLLEFCHLSKILFIPTKMLGKLNGRSLQKFVGIILFQSTEWGMFKQSVKLLTASSFRYLSVAMKDIPIVSAWNSPTAWSNVVSWHLRISSESQGSWLDSFESTTAL